MERHHAYRIYLPLKGAELDLLIVMKRTNARPRPAMPSATVCRLKFLIPLI